MTEDQARLIAELIHRCGYCHGRGTLTRTYDGRYAEADPKDVPCWYCAKIEALEALLGRPVVPRYILGEDVTPAESQELHICRQPGFDPGIHRCLGCVTP